MIVIFGTSGVIKLTNIKTMRGKSYNVEKFTPRKEKHEFPKGERGIEMCKYCGAVYYKKGWQHALKNHEKILAKFPIKKSRLPGGQNDSK